MERCISNIRMWVKTEFMLIGTKQQLSKVNIDSLTVGSIDVAPVSEARNLGTWFYSNLNLQEQIHKTCKSGFFPFILTIRCIRKYLSQESARTLVHTFIVGRIVYCNGLLFGLPSLFIYLKCNACRMQLLGLCLMFLTAVTQHQYYVHYIGFLSNFVLILKYFLLLNLSARQYSDMHLVT